MTGLIGAAHDNHLPQFLINVRSRCEGTNISCSAGGCRVEIQIWVRDHSRRIGAAVGKYQSSLYPKSRDETAGDL